jgi:hypothetical protein
VNPLVRRIGHEPVHQQFGAGDARWPLAAGGRVTAEGRDDEFPCRFNTGEPEDLISVWLE